MNFIVPEGFALGALVLGSAASVPRSAPLAYSRWVTLAALVATLGLVAWKQPDLATASMSILVAGLGAVVARFSARSLSGEPGLQRFSRALLVALGSVLALVFSNNLALLAAAWMVAGLGLHHLLAFYPLRPRAQDAARQKFLQARLADGFMLLAVGLVALQLGTLEVDVIARRIAELPALPWTLQVAAICIAAAVIVRTAQLPFHGWLLQVMEAPTPVSALLHAGVVNLGGLVLLRVSGLIDAALPARWLLLGFGLGTALLASLVSVTRPSIKTALAWSTSAQLGFMLVEAAAGAWSLALLHLVAHSAVKAHAFLSSGSTVEQWEAKSGLARARPVGRGFATASIAAGASAVSASLLAPAGHGGVVALALLPIAAWTVAAWKTARTGLEHLRLAARVLLTAGVVLGWHLLAPPPGPHALSWAVLAPALLAVAAFSGWLVAVVFDSERAVPEALRLHIEAGFGLERWWSRAIHRWASPAAAPETSAAPSALEEA